MILLKDCLCVATSLGLGRGDRPDARGVDVLIEGNRITRIAPGLRLPKEPRGARPGSPDEGVRVIDASRHVVLPGLVNTHHHFYQTLTRALPAVQDAKLFDWLARLYGIWKGIDEDAVYWSSRLALAELLATGCTLTTDHHYLYPEGFKDDLPGIQFGAAAELGLRFAPTRGSMSRSRKDGGLPPDSVVQDEDRILAESEAAIDRYHDPAPDAMRKVSLAPCSPFSVSERSMRAAAELARRKGARLHTHLAETRDEEESCRELYGRRPLRLMRDCGFVGNDVWYAHGIFFDDEELRVLADTGTGVAHCPSSNMRLGSGIARIREMLDLGVPVGLGVDGSASNDSSDMLGEARQAMLLQRVRAGLSGAEARLGGMTAREALSIASEGGARLLGYEKLGRVAEGWIADLALFDVERLEYAGSLADPVAALVLCGDGHRADHVIVNGELVLESGALAGPGARSGTDEETIRKNADRASRALLERAGEI